MNHSNNNVDNQYLLNIPVAYILQNKTVEEVGQDFDQYGWNILHHAIAEADIGKIKELMHFSFNWNINGKFNIIPEYIYQINDKKKATQIKLLKRMPYCSNGYTPIHLALHLYNHYNNLCLSGEHAYGIHLDNYRKILDLLIKDSVDLKNYTDSDGHSLLDYAFLLENFALIDGFYLKDNNLSSLKKVSTQVAKKIIEIMKLKKKFGNNYHYDPILSALDNKILNESLQSELKTNKTKEKAVNKI